MSNLESFTQEKEVPKEKLRVTCGSFVLRLAKPKKRGQSCPLPWKPLGPVPGTSQAAYATARDLAPTGLKQRDNLLFIFGNPRSPGVGYYSK
ncbi:hypothetical protein ElyMa_000574900 [Elysia marginata]|uniref:Uncharacterized protein n=1 Tax=Elysia marginata TaxID=1093978 RepID=A0AAV4G6K1_9GAST|nr:hypothetical protein ElyMa_000574900 [Elysia marginata]